MVKLTAHEKSIYANQPKELMDEVFTAEYRWIVPEMLNYTPKFHEINLNYGVSNPVTYKGKEITKSLGIYNTHFEHCYTFSKSNSGIMGALNAHTENKVGNDVLYSSVDNEVEELLNSFRLANQYYLGLKWSTTTEGPVYALKTAFSLKDGFYTYNEFFVHDDQITLERKWESKANWTKFHWFKNDNEWLRGSPFGEAGTYHSETTREEFFDKLRGFENTLSNLFEV